MLVGGDSEYFDEEQLDRMENRRKIEINKKETLAACVLTIYFQFSIKIRVSSGHQTLGRLPSHHHGIYGTNPNKYATLSKQCKTLEANDFY